MRFARGIALVALVALSACKKSTDAKPDAAAGPATVGDDALAFSLELAPEWRLESGPDAGVPGWKMAEARRIPPRGRTYLVAPKFVVSSEPAKTSDVDRVIRTTMNDIRGIEQKGARVNRSSLATRVVDGVLLGDIEIAYEVGEKKQKPQEVVQRSLVTVRSKPDGSNHVWTLTVTYMSDDAEVVAPEVQQMLAGLRFVAPDAKKEKK